MAGNGNLPPSALKPVPPGRLENSAARAWRAGPGKVGCRLLGPNSGYRSLDMQRYYWSLYQSGRGNLAAVPGTSNHGWGRAVDLAAPWMRSWIDAHGARYGWRKTEAPGEWWHVNYVGGYRPPARNPALRRLDKKQRRAAERLLYHRRERRREAGSGKGPRYARHDRAARRARRDVERLHERARGRERRILRRVLDDRNGRL